MFYFFCLVSDLNSLHWWYIIAPTGANPSNALGESVIASCITIAKNIRYIKAQKALAVDFLVWLFSISQLKYFFMSFGYTQQATAININIPDRVQITLNLISAFVSPLNNSFISLNLVVKILT
jgi:hypothetical protein